MDSAAYTHRRTRRILIATITGGLVVLLLVSIGVYGLVRGAGTDSGAPPSTPPTSSTPAVDESSTRGSGPAAVVVTGDPEVFARRVAQALFTWDTASNASPADYAQVLIDAGDASELEALASDVRSYLPTTQAWAQLRTYHARQQLTIDSISIPQAWTIAVEQAAPGQLVQGAAAYTITGTRHRSGTWGTQPQDAERQVAFTVFIACPRPTPERSGVCSLVRLSALDTPLR